MNKAQKNKKPFSDRFEGTFYGLYKSTGDVRYLYAVQLGFIAVLIMLLLFVYVVNGLLTNGLTSVASPVIFKSVGSALFFLGLAELCGYRYMASIPKLAIGVFILFIVF